VSGVHGEDALDLEDSADCKSVDLQDKGALAQLGERRLCKPEVTGSIPVRSIFRNLLICTKLLRFRILLSQHQARAA
jgi:hypothetical protein